MTHDFTRIYIVIKTLFFLGMRGGCIKMSENSGEVKEKGQLKSVLLVCVLVATSIVIIVPLTAPKAEGVNHLASADAEDQAGPPYDMDGIPGNGRVLWEFNDDHIIPTDYTVESWMTLDIPNLNWQLGYDWENTIQFVGGKRIDVYGTLITHSDGPIKQYTQFTAEGLGGWDGLYFHHGSKGVFLDVRINNSVNGIVMEPGSSLLSPGLDGVRFENFKAFGMRMDGVTGATNITLTNFHRRAGLIVDNGIGLEVANGALNISGNSTFNSHGPNLHNLRIMNATVNLDSVRFRSHNQTGYSVIVEGGGSNDTVFNNCLFQQGVADNYYIRSDGASFLVNNGTFDTADGQLTVIANDLGIPANPILRNPKPPVWPFGIFFDNTTMNATGGSSVILQWYHDVYVEDPNGNRITNAPVWIKDRLGNPAIAPVNMTNDTGWTTGFIVTEFIEYSGSVTNFNPFNFTAENNTMFGYVTPEEIINRSMVNKIVVPFNPIPTIPPIVSYLNIVPVPGGIQTGLVTIEFMLEDPDVGDDGNLSVEVQFWDPIGGMGWAPAALHPSSDPTTLLNNNTLYTIIWDSKAMGNFPLSYMNQRLLPLTMNPHSCYQVLLSL
jgi:hypothetical protein